MEHFEARMMAGNGGKPLPDWDSIVRGNPEKKEKQEFRHLYIYKDQVMYDINAQVGMMQRTRKADNGVENDDYTEMIEKYSSMIDRWILRAIDKVKDVLIIAVWDEHNTALGDEMKSKDEWEILLKFPEWWDDTAWRPLVQCVHDCVVDYVIAEYYKIILSAKDPLCVTKSEDADERFAKLKGLLTKHKVGSIKRPLRPMGF